MTRTFTKPDQAMLDKYAPDMRDAINLYIMCGDGVQAAGAVITRLCKGTMGDQYVTHFLNLQTGGFHSGNYDDSLEVATANYERRCLSCDPDQSRHYAWESI